MRGLALLSLTFVLVCQPVTESSALPKPAKCVVKSADVAFLIDSSGSVGSNEWKQALNFASNVVKGYNVGRNEVRVALIVFSDTAKVVFDFNKYTTKDQIISAITAAPKENRGTYTDVALDLARNRLFQESSGMRAGVPHIVMVITDGKSQRRSKTFASAQSLHARNITVFAVGVKGADASELNGIATNQYLVHTYTDFNKLIALQDSFNSEACKVAVKLASTTPTTTTTTPTTTTTTPTTTTTTPTTTTTTPTTTTTTPTTTTTTPTTTTTTPTTTTTTPTTTTTTPTTTTTTPTTTTPAQTTPKPCKVETADIGFIVDASGSVNEIEWRQSLDFVTKIVSEYDIGANKVRVGLIIFSSGAYTIFNFNKYTTKAEVIAAIYGTRQISGSTYIHFALSMARKSLFQESNGMRPGVPNMLFVITDAESSNRKFTAIGAKALRATNITVFAVGIAGANAEELESIASKPEYVYTVGDFNELAVIQNQLIKETCKVGENLAQATGSTSLGEPSSSSSCADKRQCAVFQFSDCTNPDLRNFMYANCRLFCNFCDVEA